MSDTCPITREVFVDPVLASDGHTYEYGALKEWVAEKPARTSPLTKEVLRPLVYVNGAARDALRLPRLSGMSGSLGARRLYDAVQGQEFYVQVDGRHAKTPWVVGLLTAKRWRRAALRVRFVAERGTSGWKALGPPAACPYAAPLVELVSDMGLDTLVTNPDCMTDAVLVVDGKDAGRLEAIAGCADADALRCSDDSGP